MMLYFVQMKRQVKYISTYSQPRKFQNSPVFRLPACLPACPPAHLPAIIPGCARCRAPEILHNYKGNDNGFTKMLFQRQLLTVP